MELIYLDIALLSQHAGAPTAEYLRAGMGNDVIVMPRSDTNAAGEAFRIGNNRAIGQQLPVVIYPDIPVLFQFTTAITADYKGAGKERDCRLIPRPDSNVARPAI